MRTGRRESRPPFVFRFVLRSERQRSGHPVPLILWSVVGRRRHGERCWQSVPPPFAWLRRTHCYAVRSQQTPRQSLARGDGQASPAKDVLPDPQPELAFNREVFSVAGSSATSEKWSSEVNRWPKTARSIPNCRCTASLTQPILWPAVPFAAGHSQRCKPPLHFIGLSDSQLGWCVPKRRPGRWWHPARPIAIGDFRRVKVRLSKMFSASALRVIAFRLSFFPSLKFPTEQNIAGVGGIGPSHCRPLASLGRRCPSKVVEGWVSAFPLGYLVATTDLGLATRRISATVAEAWKALSSDGERFLSAKENYERYKSGRPSSILPSGSRDWRGDSTADGAGVRCRTRRRLRRQGEEVGDYLIDAGKELVDKCEDLYERSGEVVDDQPTSCPGNIGPCMSTAGNCWTKPKRSSAAQEAPPSAGNQRERRPEIYSGLAAAQGRYLVISVALS